MNPKTITELITIAQSEHSRQLHRLANMRNLVSIDDFKKLFIARAQQTMHERKNFNDFVVDDANKEVINLMYRYILKSHCEINPYVGIILNGRFGCGKSVLIEAFCKVLNDLTPRERDRIETIHAIELVDQIRLNGVIPYSKKNLCIQDLGKEKIEINDFGTKYKPISELLAVRAENGAITFGSTNLLTKTFGEFYDPYIGARITEHVNLVFLQGDNRRPDYSINQPVKNVT